MQTLFDYWYTKYEVMKRQLQINFGKIPTIGHIEAHPDRSQLVDISQCDSPKFTQNFYKDDKWEILSPYITALVGLGRHGHNFLSADKNFYFDHVKSGRVSETDEFGRWLASPCHEMPLPLSNMIVTLPPYDRATGTNVSVLPNTGITFDIQGNIEDAFVLITRLDCGGIAINCCFEDKEIGEDQFVYNFFTVARDQHIIDLLSFLNKRPRILLPILTAFNMVYMLLKPDAMREGELTENLRNLKRKIVRGEPKMGKFGIRSIPKFSHFILQNIKPSIAINSEIQDGDSGREVKPHQRKGFYRLQRCGPGRKEVKEVFVRDTIVHRERFKGGGDNIVTKREV